MYFHEKAEQGIIFTEEGSTHVGINIEFKNKCKTFVVNMGFI
jgi:hypothetical protein